MKPLADNDYSLYGEEFKSGKPVWIIELICYESYRDSVGVVTSIYQGNPGTEPSTFATRKQAEAEIPRMLSNVSGHQLIGYSIKKITLVTKK